MYSNLYFFIVYFFNLLCRVIFYTTNNCNIIFHNWVPSFFFDTTYMKMYINKPIIAYKLSHNEAV